MNKISNEIINYWIGKVGFMQGTGDKIEIDVDHMLQILQELKERRESYRNRLDIKDQLRLVRDKCPDVWREFHKGQYSSGYCYREFMGGDNSCLAKTCKECWDKALEGDER